MTCALFPQTTNEELDFILGNDGANDDEGEDDCRLPLLFDLDAADPMTAVDDDGLHPSWLGGHARQLSQGGSVAAVSTSGDSDSEQHKHCDQHNRPSSSSFSSSADEAMDDTAVESLLEFLNPKAAHPTEEEHEEEDDPSLFANLKSEFSTADDDSSCFAVVDPPVTGDSSLMANGDSLLLADDALLLAEFRSPASFRMDDDDDEDWLVPLLSGVGGSSDALLSAMDPPVLEDLQNFDFDDIVATPPTKGDSPGDKDISPPPLINPPADLLPPCDPLRDNFVASSFAQQRCTSKELPRRRRLAAEGPSSGRRRPAPSSHSRSLAPGPAPRRSSHNRPVKVPLGAILVGETKFQFLPHRPVIVNNNDKPASERKQQGAEEGKKGGDRAMAPLPVPVRKRHGGGEMGRPAAPNKQQKQGPERQEGKDTTGPGGESATVVVAVVDPDAARLARRRRRRARARGQAIRMAGGDRAEIGRLAVADSMNLSKKDDDSLLKEFAKNLDPEIYVSATFEVTCKTLLLEAANKAASSFAARSTAGGKKRARSTSPPPAPTSANSARFLKPTTSAYDAGKKCKTITSKEAIAAKSSPHVKKSQDNLKMLPSGKDPESRKLRQLMRNRASAQASRDRRKRAIEEAQRVKAAKEREIEALERRLKEETQRMLQLERAVVFARSYLGPEKYSKVAFAAAVDRGAAKKTRTAKSAPRRANVVHRN